MQANRFLTLLLWAGCLVLHACTDEVDPASAGFSYVSGLPNPPQVNAESAESVKSYVSWLGNEENGYIKRRTIGSFWFEGLLEPPAYAVLLNHRGERVTNDTINEEVKEQAKLFQIQFSIGSDSLDQELLKYGLTDEMEYQNRITYYSFNMNRDIFLVVGTDTLPCVTYQWERGFDLSRKLVFQLVFSAKDWKGKVDGFQLVYYDRVFNNGIIKFFYGK